MPCRLGWLGTTRKENMSDAEPPLSDVTTEPPASHPPPPPAPAPVPQAAAAHRLLPPVPADWLSVLSQPWIHTHHHMSVDKLNLDELIFWGIAFARGGRGRGRGPARPEARGRGVARRAARALGGDRPEHGPPDPVNQTQPVRKKTRSDPTRLVHRVGAGHAFWPGGIFGSDAGHDFSPRANPTTRQLQNV